MVTVQASDRGTIMPRSSQLNLTVHVDDVNDNTPVFIQQVTIATIGLFYSPYDPLRYSNHPPAIPNVPVIHYFEDVFLVVHHQTHQSHAAFNGAFV